MKVEMSEDERIVVKVPKTARIVSHGVEGAGDEVMAGVVTVCPLQEGVQTKEVGSGSRAGGRAFLGPGNGGPVVTVEPDCALVHMPLGHQQWWRPAQGQRLTGSCVDNQR